MSPVRRPRSSVGPARLSRLNPLYGVLRFLKIARRYADPVYSSMSWGAGATALVLSLRCPEIFYVGASLCIVGSALAAGCWTRRRCRR